MSVLQFPTEGAKHIMTTSSVEEILLKRLGLMTSGAICELAHQSITMEVEVFNRISCKGKLNYMLDQQISVRICHLGDIYHEGGDLKKATGDLERAIRHWSIAASTGCYRVMHELRDLFERSAVRRESINFNFGSIQ